MHTRRSHQKSRNGCKTCKKRRIKCDEAGPPCGQCKLKSIECVYPPPSTRASKSPVPTKPPPSPKTKAPASASPLPIRSIEGHCFVEQHPASSSNRLIELELMHQWSTVTYKSMCGDLTDDYFAWQVLIPREALKHDYLLYDLLATSALEIAMSSDQATETSQYFSIALEYQDIALTRFRASCTDVTESNHFALFVFSVLNMILSIAIPQYQEASMVTSMIFHFDLLRSIGSITLISMKWLQEGAFSAHMKPLEAIPMGALDQSTKEALERLNNLNEERNDINQLHSRAEKIQVMRYHSACRKAIFNLQESFARCIEPKQYGYSLGWLNLSGEEYVQVVRDSDPIALLIFMHWGVLLHRTGSEFWWAQTAGRSLVNELSNAIHAGNNLLIGAGITWAREQVGLQGTGHSFNVPLM